MSNHAYCIFNQDTDERGLEITRSRKLLHGASDNCPFYTTPLGPFFTINLDQNTSSPPIFSGFKTKYCNWRKDLSNFLSDTIDYWYTFFLVICLFVCFVFAIFFLSFLLPSFGSGGGRKNMCTEKMAYPPDLFISITYSKVKIHLTCKINFKCLLLICQHEVYGAYWQTVYFLIYVSKSFVSQPCQT